MCRPCWLLLIYVVLALSDSDELVRQGDQEFISKHYEKAIDHYSAAINQDSANFRAYYKRATVYAQTNRLRQALFDLAQVLNLNSDYYLALQSRAKIHQDMGNWEDALTDLKKVKKLKPDMASKIDTQISELTSLQSMIEFADTLYKDGAWSEAKNYYTKALDKANNLFK